MTSGPYISSNVPKFIFCLFGMYSTLRREKNMSAKIIASLPSRFRKTKKKTGRHLANFKGLLHGVAQFSRCIDLKDFSN